MYPGFVAAVLVAASLSSQLGRLWTFSELVAESELVLIGKALNVRETDRKAAHPQLRPALPAVELETDIRVLAVLKRNAEANTDDIRQLVLHHFRLDLEEWRRQHPTAPGEPPPGLLNAGEHLMFKSPDETHLFFLKRGPLGWEPATGHTFPNQSVFPLVGANRLGG